MLDFHSFTPNLPPFLERNYYISPGIVTVVLKISWSIFTFLVVTFLIRYSYASAGENKDKDEMDMTVWDVYSSYERTQIISRGDWGGMITKWRSSRILFALLCWLILYAFEILFSLSIDSSPVTIYSGEQCVGRVNNVTLMKESMWDYNASSTKSEEIPTNNTFLRQLLNIRQVNHFVLLGDGVFAVSPSENIYAKGQRINVARTGFDCNTTAFLPNLNVYGVLNYFSNTTNETVISLPPFLNISVNDIEAFSGSNVDVRMMMSNSTADFVTWKPQDRYFLISIKNPRGLKNNDINLHQYNASLFFNVCRMFYQHGYVTVADQGSLNQDNLDGGFTIVEDKVSLDANFLAAVDGFLFTSSQSFLTVYDYPDEFVNTKYNKPYTETLKSINDIVAAHFINGLNQTEDPCIWNDEKVPSYVSALGTKVSFGYIIVGVVFAFVVLGVLSLFATTAYDVEQRKRWQAYSKLHQATAYISAGRFMEEEEFKNYSESKFIKKDEYEEKIEDDSGESLLSKKSI